MTDAPALAPFPLLTPRLLIRPLRAGDAPVIAAYRADPDVARHQDWDLPYTLADAERLVAEMAGVPWPAHGQWIQLAVEHGGTTVGDLGILRSADGAVATLGYTLAPAHQGRGYASEAAGAVVDLLFAEGVHRVVATADPDNLPSALVLDRLGFRYEGRDHGAALVRGEWVDDDRYALLADERGRWVARDRTPPRDVELVPITARNRQAVLELRTTHAQERFVAPVLQSFAEALVPPDDSGGGPAVPWFRAVAADGVLAGFVMLAEPSPTNDDPYLWRLLVDRWHQGRGIGRRAVETVIAERRWRGDRRLLVSWVPGPGGPARFYERLGFVPTGALDDGEVVAAREL